MTAWRPPEPPTRKRVRAIPSVATSVAPSTGAAPVVHLTVRVSASAGAGPIPGATVHLRGASRAEQILRADADGSGVRRVARVGAGFGLAFRNHVPNWRVRIDWRVR